MKRFFIILATLIAVLLVVYLAGPRPEKESLNTTIPEIELGLDSLSRWIDSRERSVSQLKMDNQARIVWFDESNKKKTEFAVVYLHGFSASQGEGYPVHLDFARRYGCNLYLSRMPGHGVANIDAMSEATAGSLMASAAEAIAVGRVLGDKVIVMSTSAGSTLSLYLAQDNPEIHSLIMFSPCIRLKDSRSTIIAGPWGLQIAEKMMGGAYASWPYDSFEDSIYWTKRYPVQALVNLQVLLEQTMNDETFERIAQPLFVGYYYMDENKQDPVVSVPAMMDMFIKVGTPESLKRHVAFPNAEDHVIASEYRSESVPEVRRQVFKFAEEIIGLKPVTLDAGR